MIKKLSLVGLFLIMIMASGCEKKTEVIKIPEKNYEKTVVEEDKIDIDGNPDNVRHHDSGVTQDLDIKEYSTSTENVDFIARDKKITINIDGQTQNMTYEKLANVINSTLNKKYKDYKIKEELVYNYVQITSKESKGIYLHDNLEETRMDEQYYKDDSRTTGNNDYLRQIKGVKYKNRANEDLYVGTFLTREKNKPVKIEWTEEYNEDDLALLEDIKTIDFVGITDFYKDSWNGLNDFKARGEMSLKQWKDTILLTTHTGTQTLKHVEAQPKIDVTEKGVTKEKTMTIRPLEELKFPYTLTVKDNVITMEANLTSTIANYYKLFKNYNIKECTYKIVVEEILDAEGKPINEQFEEVKTEESNEDSKEDEGKLEYKDNVDPTIYKSKDDIKEPEEGKIYFVGQEEIEEAYEYKDNEFNKLDSLENIYKEENKDEKDITDDSTNNDTNESNMQ